MGGSFSFKVRRVGAMSLFGLGVLLASVAYQVISLEDPNAPVAIAHKEPLYEAESTTTAVPARQVVEGGPAAVEVLGVIETKAAASGVILGEWVLFERDQFTRFIVSETPTGTMLTVTLPSGESIEQSLTEDENADGGRLFSYASGTSDDTFFIGDNGNLSLGDADGLRVTLGATS